MNTAQSFTAVLDGRKHKVRNLWQRGDIFYARLKITYPGEEVPKMRRVLLKAKTVSEATKELRELQVKRDKGKTIVRGRTPTLKEYGQKYIDRLFKGNRKRPATITSENGHFTSGPGSLASNGSTESPRGRFSGHWTNAPPMESTTHV
jgi:hypothetical protein